MSEGRVQAMGEYTTGPVYLVVDGHLTLKAGATVPSYADGPVAEGPD
jgi:hypothetical protein